MSATATPVSGSTTQYSVTITFTFPNTNSGSQSQRFLQLLHIDPFGRQTTLWDSSYNYFGRTGSITFTIDTSCWAEGPHQLVPVARHDCAGSKTNGAPQTITIQRSPVLSPTVTKNADGSNHVSIPYQFFDSGTAREIHLQLLPTPDLALASAGDYVALPMQGTIDLNVGVPEDRSLRILATNGGCYETDKTDGLQGCCCPSGGCAGNPVRMWDGAMTTSDVDPLPDDFRLMFRRTYQSNFTRPHAFGTGWFSAFGSGIAVADTAQHKTVILYTEDHHHFVFDQLQSGAWLQVWPTGTPTGTLTGSESSGYTYREAGSLITRLYGGSGSHHLLGYKDLQSGRQVTISYDASGHPTSVGDNFGAWTANVTTDGTGRVTQIAVSGRPDLTWNYAYDASGNLTTVSLGTTGWRTYGYVQTNGVWLLASVADALGNLLEQHAYDANGRAITSLGSAGDLTNIQYSATNPSTTVVTAADGSTTTYTQVMADREVTTQLAGGCSACGSHDVTTAYDAAGHVWRVQDGRGYITESIYDATPYRMRNLISETRALQPSGCDPSTDPAHCALSSSALATATLVTSPASHTTTYLYGDTNWPDRPTEIDREGVLSTTTSERFTYDAVTGVVLTHSFNGATGSDAHQETHTTTTTLYNGSEGAAFNPGGAFQSSWLSLAQPSGRVKTVVGPRTDVLDTTTFVYYPNDSSVPATWRTRAAASRNALNQITRFEDYDVFGNAATVTDPSGVITSRTFDALGRVLTSTLKGVSGCNTTADPLCATDLVTSHSYANVTGPLSLIQRPSTPAGTPGVAYVYDSRGRLSAMQRGQVSGGVLGASEQAVYTYDAATQKKATESYQSFANGAWSEAFRESYAYDPYGRLARTTHADNASVVYGYDAADDLVSVQDERHSTPNTTYTFDGARRLTGVSQTLGSGTVNTSYGYDVRDNLKSVTDPNGNATTYLYDDFGRLLTQTSPVTGVTSYTYNSGDDLLTVADANGAVTTRVYDALHRVTSAASAGGPGASESVTWTYDGATPFGIGRMASMNDPAGSSTFAYDRRGLLLSEARTDDATYTTSYQYDGDGNRSAITYPSGLVLQYQFDYARRPLWVALGGVYLATAGPYLPFGPLTQIVYGDGTTKAVSYDNRYRVTENKLINAVTGTLADYVYADDAAGNITQIHDALDATFNRDFAYDDLSRLITANTGTSLWGAGSYTYDPMGNLLTVDLGGTVEADPNQPLGCKTCFRPAINAVPAPGSRHEIYVYHGTTPLLDHVTNVTLMTPAAIGQDQPVTYDAAGNEVRFEAGRTYSARNLMTAVTDLSGEGSPAHQIAYTYDGRGVRVRRSESPTPSGPVTRRYFYTPELQLLTETTDDQQNVWGANTTHPRALANTRFDIVWFGGLPVAQLAGSTTRYTFTDHLGTPLLLEAGGNIIWRAEYDPYGDLYTLRAGTSRFDQPLRFPGQEVAMDWEGHEESYNIFRWYGAGMGRYTQADPIGVIGGVNLYGYARANPVSVTDRFGLFGVDTIKCCYYMWRCSSEGSDCANQWRSKLAQLDDEEKLQLFESAHVVTESDFLKKKCFDANENCRKMIVTCGSTAVQPTFMKDSGDPSPEPMDPKKWWQFWR